MKKTIGLLLVCVLLLSGCGNRDSGQQPQGMNSKVYQWGTEALQIADNYLDGRTPIDDAMDKLDEVYENLFDGNFDSDVDRAVVTAVSRVNNELYAVSIDNDPDDLLLERNRLANALGKEAR